jgi:hypothetical protein
MSRKSQGKSEKELAEFYDRTHDLSEFEGGEAFPVEVRRNVTISVRFSEEEIGELRREAEAAGVKVTAYIRAAALQANAPLDRKQLREALRAVSDDVERAERLLADRA